MKYLIYSNTDLESFEFDLNLKIDYRKYENSSKFRYKIQKEAMQYFDLNSARYTEKNIRFKMHFVLYR